MNHEGFKKKYLGKLFDFDKVAGPQCADVAKAYVQEVHGKIWRAFEGYPNINGGVINAFLNYPNCFIYEEDYKLVENNASDANQIPKQGDIIIWGDYELTGPEGHIAVVDSANKQGFVSIDQNWNDGRGLQTKLVHHNYRGILGWLELKENIDPTEEAKIIAQTEAVKAEPAINHTITNNQPGVSYILRDLGSTAWKEQWAWETVGQSNGFRPSDFELWNANLKVGQIIRVPKRLVLQSSIKTKNTTTKQQSKTATEDVVYTDELALPVLEGDTSEKKQTVRQPLPLYQRSVYDSLRNGSYAIGAFVLANGGQEIVDNLLKNEINQDSLLTAALGLSIIFVGYIQERMKEERKELEKTII
jgi:hypothetical protein